LRPSPPIQTVPSAAAPTATSAPPKPAGPSTSVHLSPSHASTSGRVGGKPNGAAALPTAHALSGLGAEMSNSRLRDGALSTSGVGICCQLWPSQRSISVRNSSAPPIVP
jgi:hypothetical protein